MGAEPSKYQTCLADQVGGKVTSPAFPGNVSFTRRGKQQSHSPVLGAAAPTGGHHGQWGGWGNLAGVTELQVMGKAGADVIILHFTRACGKGMGEKDGWKRWDSVPTGSG